MSTVPDLINGTFESLASVMILLHCRQLVKHKLVRGVSIPAVVFFMLWGFWNLFYYHHLDQSISWLGGMAVVVANTLQVSLLLRYRDRAVFDARTLQLYFLWR